MRKRLGGNVEGEKENKNGGGEGRGEGEGEGEGGGGREMVVGKGGREGGGERGKVKELYETRRKKCGREEESWRKEVGGEFDLSHCSIMSCEK